MNVSYVVNWTAEYAGGLRPAQRGQLTREEDESERSRQPSLAQTRHQVESTNTSTLWKRPRLLTEDPQAVYPVPLHVPPEALLLPHFDQTRQHTLVRLTRRIRLHLPGKTRTKRRRRGRGCQQPNECPRSSGELGRTHMMILSRSSGDTTVREVTPAIPPATKYSSRY